MVVRIYELSQASTGKVKKILEAQDQKDKAGKWVMNEFKTQGYVLQDGKGLGCKEEFSYLKIEASEDFFKKNEKALLDAGAKLMKDKDAKAVEKKMKEAEESAVAGMGSIFG